MPRAQRGRSVESSIAIAIAIAIGWGGRKRLRSSTSNVCALRFDRARERRAGDRTKRMGLKFGTETMPRAIATKVEPSGYTDSMILS